MSWPDESWMAALAASWPRLPPLGDLTGEISLSVPVAPRKEAGVSFSYVGGAATAGAVGANPDADLSLTFATAADAADLFTGRVATSVSFMRGRLKASGDGKLLLALLRSTTSAEFGGWLESLDTGALHE